MNKKLTFISITRLIALIIFSEIYFQSFSQTVTSTTSGGYWTATTTWIGGVLPTSTDNVVINGRVIYNLSPTCNNLTINSGDTLFGGASNYTLTINGSVTNNGALMRDPSSWYTYVDIKGNIINNGGWSPYLTYFSGTTTQTISCGVGKVLQGGFQLIKSNSFVQLVSDAGFSGSWLNMNTDTLRTNGYKLNFNEVDVYSGTIISNDTITINSKSKSWYDVIFRGDVKIKGTWFYDYGNTFIGRLSVMDTIMDRYSNYTITVQGDLINYGAILRDPNAWYNNIDVTGNIENYGKWSPYYTRLIGNQIQNIKQSSGKFFEGNWLFSDTNSFVQLTSDVTFNSASIDFNTDSLKTNGHQLSLLNTAFTNGRIVSSDTITIINNGATFSNINFLGDVNLKGKIWYQHNNIFYGSLTVLDTFIDNYSNYTVTVYGNLINKGAILRDLNSWYNNIDVKGNIENYGIWKPYYTRLIGNQVQSIKQSSGKMFESNWLFSDTNSYVQLTSDVTFSSASIELNTDSLKTNGYQLSLLSTGISNGRIVSNDTITIINNGAAFNNLNFIGNVKLRGKIWYQNNNYFYGNLTLLDSFINNFSNHIVAIYGDLINKGAILRDPNNWYNYIDVTGNIENYGIWKPYFTRFMGNSIQNIKQSTGKSFEGNWQFTDTNSFVQLQSNITFNNATIDLNTDSLKTNGFKLSLLSTGISNGRIISNDTITVINNGATFSNLTFLGDVKLNGKVWYQQNNLFSGTLTVLDTFIDNFSNYTVTVNGNLINKGAILRDPNAWYNNIDVTGNIENYGKWSPYYTRLTGNQIQSIKQSTSKIFESNWIISDTNSYIQLASNVNFANADINLNADTLKTNGYKLNLLSTGIYNGNILTNDSITINNLGAPFRDLTFVGDAKLFGKIWYQQNNLFNGNLTVFDTMIDNYSNYNITVKGNFTNKGAYLRDPQNWYNTLTTYGNITIDGPMNIFSITLKGTGSRNLGGIAGSQITNIVTIDDSISLSGDNIVGGLNFSGNTKAWCTITKGGSISLSSLSNAGRIINYGRVSVVQDIDSAAVNSYTFYAASLANKKGTKVNKITIDHYGNQQHPVASGTVNSWWRLRNYPQYFNDSLSWLKLNYTTNQLNGNNEDSLKIFHSPNAGISWNRIKTGISIDKTNKLVNINNAPSYGHFLISATPLGITTFRPTLERAEPRVGGNTGQVTMYIYGAGFKSTSTAKLTLTGQSDIIADTTYMTDALGESVLAKFNLKGKTTGVYDLIISTPGDTTLTLPAYFTIQTGLRSKPWASLSGRDRFLINRWQTFYINYGNTSNTDAKGTMLVFVINDLPGLEVTFPDIKVVLPKPVRDLGTDYTRISDSVKIYYTTTTLTGYEGKSMRVYPFYIPFIAAGTTTNSRVKIKLTGAGSLTLNAWMMDPFYEGIDYSGKTSEPMPTEVRACITAAAMKYTWTSAIGLIPGAGCYNLVDKIVDPVGYITPESIKPEDTPTDTWGSWIWNKVSWASSITQCATSFMPGIGQVTSIGIGLAGMIIDSKDNYDATEGCWRKFKKKSEDKRDSRGVTSFDPNEIVGPQGFGTDKYISKKGNMNYRIYFENKSTAGAAALEVFVTDTIDKTKFDLTTFSFGNVTFGDTSVRVQEFAKEFTLLVDLSPKKNVVVQVHGILDTAKGIIYWDFHSLDKISLILTEDPALGFLPPNISSPEGEGNVAFSCLLKQSVAHNDIINNRASIVFDFNAPILTNTYTNKIDAIAPVSAVNPLSINQTDTVFNVSWAGTDQGCGIMNFNVFVSTNDSAYLIWKSNTNLTSSQFKGKNNFKYKFFCLATDSIGLAEPQKFIAEATTTVKLSSSDVTEETIITPSFKIYPNPTSNLLHLEINLQTSELVNIFITDIAGRSVELTKNMNVSSGKNAIEFNMSEFKNGLYFITVQTSKEKWTQKISIIK